MGEVDKIVVFTDVIVGKLHEYRLRQANELLKPIHFILKTRLVKIVSLIPNRTPSI